jgi:hypothetical protein
MSQLSTYGWEQPQIEEYSHTPVSAHALIEPAQRSIMQPILLLIPILSSGVSFLAGGLPVLTDFSWVMLALLCAIFLMGELYRFPERLGIGGIVLYGGVLVWFCYDYMTNWFMAWYPNWTADMPAEVIAKSTAAHMLFIFFMSLGLRLRIGRWLPRLVASLPEPSKSDIFFYMVLFTQVAGLIIPYSVFTSEPLYLSIYHAMISDRGQIGPAFTVGRTGNANYSWGAYVAQLIQFGEVGGLLAAYCLIFLRQGIFQKIVCFIIWVIWLLIGLGTGARGEVVFMMMPVVCFLFIRFNVSANQYVKRFNFVAYVMAIVTVLIAVCLVQIAYRFRGQGLEDVDLSTVSYTQLEGNHMFSEGLVGFALIPERHRYFYDAFPGETIVMPIPQFIYYLVVHPIPRALWWNKPIDPATSWYNDVAMGGSGENGGKVEGVTISQGLAGCWFFRFGVAGLIEGGLFFGWLLGCTERTLLNSHGKTLPILAALCTATWLFRCFRDVRFFDFYQFALGLLAMTLIIYPLSRHNDPAPLAVHR